MEEQDPNSNFDMNSIIIEEQYLAAQEIVFNSPTQSPEDYKNYVISHIRRYDKQSSIMRLIHNGLQLIIFVGAAVVTIVNGVQEIPRIIPTIISGIVALATVFANYYKFSERSRNLYFTAEGLALEYNWFSSGRGPYKSKASEESLELFMNRIENLMHKQAKRSFALEELKRGHR